ncbi:MAG: DUF3276 family protein [Cytophagales bacterium]|nr:MAG: DUF3276 family protein [Cytophagales bacterium]
MEENKEQEKAEIYSKRVKAGKRTYFFDIKSTRSSDYYLTITESKKRFKEDGFFYEKHKIFLYKEDFTKFIGALEETIQFLKSELMPEVDFSKFDEEPLGVADKDFESSNQEKDNKTESTELSWD